MPEIDPVILQLRADVSKYQADLRAATATVDRLTGQQAAAVRRLETQFKASTSNISTGLRGFAGTLAATFGAGFGLQQVTKFADTFTTIQNQLRLAGLEGKAFDSTYKQLLGTAQQYGVSLEGLAQVYGRTSQGAKELGASNEQLLQLTTAVGAAIKINGGSATSSAGALLQLSQALGGTIVRAEEFNSINEGARPLLQAAANGIERYGGSVAKLRADVIEGRVTSREFFQGILAGSAALEDQAAKSVNTVSQSLQILNNAFTDYTGRAGVAKVVTEGFAGAVKFIADNLDTLAGALATIAVVIGVRYTAGLVAATAASVGLRVAAFGLTAALSGTAAAAGIAGSSLLAAFGGPVVAAITAVAIGIGFLATQQSDAERATQALADGNQRGIQVTERLRDATEKLATAHGLARVEALALANAERENVKQKLSSAQASLALARAEVARTAAVAKAQSAAATSLSNPDAAFGGFRAGNAVANQAATRAKEAENRLSSEVAAIQKGLSDAANIISGGIKTPNVASVSGGAKPKKTSGSSGSSRADTSAKDAQRNADIELANQAELRRLDAELIQDKLRITTDAEKRYELQRQLDDIEYQDRLEAIRNNRDLNARQKSLQEQKLNEIFGKGSTPDEIVAGITNRNLELKRQRDEAIQTIARAELEEYVRVLESRKATAKTNEERLTIDRQILTYQQAIERSILEEQIAQGRIKDATFARAALAERQSNANVGLDRENAGPLRRFADSLDDVSVNDRVEEAVVRKLESVNQGISDAISKSIGAKDPFIKDLINILINEVLLKPIAQALASASGGGGGFGGILSSVGAAFGFGGGFGGGLPFGRAGGGPVNAGQLYRVNEIGQEFFRPNQSGTVIPLGSERTQSPAQSQQMAVRIEVVEGQLFATRTRAIAGQISIETVQATAPQIIDAGASEALRRANRGTL